MMTIANPAPCGQGAGTLRSELRVVAAPRGGEQCWTAFSGLCTALASEFRQHDRIIQALADHYHIGAMHPFGDGNGRTSRALETFMLRQANVSSLMMVSLSNYHYEHKDEYLAALFESRQRGHDLTPFLRFALPAVATRCNAVAASIANHTCPLMCNGAG